MKKNFITHALIFFLLLQLTILHKGYSQQIIDTTRIYGVTIDNVSGLDTICTALRNHCKKVTVRLAFDKSVSASYYTEAVDSIHNVAFTMGEIFDSYFVDSFTVPAYINKADQYVNTLSNKIDIWEIGNEINGEWLGNSDSVEAKMTAVYSIVKSHHKKTALTLFYNTPCYYVPPHEMFNWVNDYVPDSVKLGLDYVLVSYYDDSCNGFHPNWQHIFDSLHTIFPNSKLGMGECGTESEPNKDSFINRYYTMNITTPGYIGGYFWWFYRHDCIPYTISHWTTLNNAICTSLSVNSLEAPSFTIKNYPNPFSNSTEIHFKIDKKEKINLTLYDNTGRLVQVLMNEEKDKGDYQIQFNAANLADGIYLYKLSTLSETTTRIMVISR